MITQHVVTFGGEVTLTRLPAGRAEGYIWLSFVARGIDPTEPESAWRVRDHVKLTWLDGSDAEVVERGSTRDESLHLFDVAIRDAGYSTITISYVEDEQVISNENVPLPPAPAV